MDIRYCISELLAVHNCVIIPGFGGFIGNYQPAAIDPESHTFHPPSKKILFNTNLKQNDGLLISYLAGSNGLSYDRAERLVSDFAMECTGILHEGLHLQIPRVGKLMAGKEGTVQFEQFKNSNLLQESFGLCPFISPPVNVPKRRMKVAHTANNAAMAHHRLAVGLLRWAAILALPIGIATVIGIMQYDSVQARFTSNAGIINSVFSNFSSASLFEKKLAPSTLPSRVVEQSPVSALPLTSEASPETVSSPEPAAIPVVVKKNSPEFTSNRYAVIIGVFRQKENAEKLVDGLNEQGVAAVIFDQSPSGLYRVAMGSFGQKEEAIQLLDTARDSGFEGAWLLTK